MVDLQSREYDEKQLLDVITDVFHTLADDDEVLTAPDSEGGIFKYSGTSPDAQFHLTKQSKKRDAKRVGLGFVIQRAELPDRYRLSFDIEVSPDVIGRDTSRLIEHMNLYASGQYGMQAPDYIVYFQPAHSGLRGWENKTFIGVEMDVAEKDLNSLPKLKKKLLNSIRKLFQALDYAMVQD